MRFFQSTHTLSIPSAIAFIVSLSFLLSCHSPEKQPAGKKTAARDSTIEAAAKNMAGSFNRETSLRFDSLQLDSFFVKFPLLVSYQNDVRSFYNSRHYSYAWYDTTGQLEQAANMYSRFRNLAQEGITGSLPYIGTLDSLMDNQQVKEVQPAAETELLLTGLYFYFAGKVWGGLGEHEAAAVEWFLPRKKVSYEGWLDSLLKTAAGTTAFSEPVYRQYNLLRNYLAKYQSVEKAHAWNALPETRSSYRLGDSGTVVGLLRQKLFQTGDLPDSTPAHRFDTSLQLAVKKFQHRFGVKEDGVVTPSLVRELNVPLQKRIQTIMTNMERSRWLPMEVSGEYLAVNIPEFRLHVYSADSLLWDMNVVVGKSASKTVVFSGFLSNVVFSPYWNVPSSIVKAEILPGIKRNPNYLASHHMERYSGGYRQLPGPWNSLGQVKFLFPNSYSIYLHDTPSRNLFQEDKRAFSHGCIRVAEPGKLATYLLSGDTTWNTTKIGTAMSSGKEKWVTLKKKIPVFITYFTAWVDRQGNLNFRDDIYNRDSRLADMIMRE